ncbi:MAG: DNA internalization-related competence protein ComEC/Rec2 [Comamonas sp.]
MGGAGFAALAGWVLGVALQLGQARLWPLGAYGGALAAASLFLVACAYRHRMTVMGMRGAVRGLSALLLVAMAAAGFAQTGARAVLMQRDVLPPSLEGVDLWVTGVVDGLPQDVAGDLRLTLRVEQMAVRDGEGLQALAVPPGQGQPQRLQLTWYRQPFASSRGAAAEAHDEDAVAVSPEEAMRAVQPGERWQLPVRLRAPHGSANPHAFDYELWLWGQGIQAVGYVRDSARPAPRRLGQTGQVPMEQWRAAVRQSIAAQLEGQAQAARMAGLLSALVLGDQRGIAGADWAVFRDTGIAHLVAISGLHITLFCVLAVKSVGWGWRRSARLLAWMPAPAAALAVGVALSALYAAFSGWGVPAQRTVWMLAMAAALRLAGMRWPRPMVWLAVMAVVVAVDPWALMQAGFWLSFVAVGVLFASGEPRERGEGCGGSQGQPGVGPRGRMATRLRAGLWAMLREQWRVAVSLMPLTLLLFQQMSVVGLAVNVLAIPVVTFLVLPLALLGVALPVLWSADAWLLAWVMDALEWCAALPGAAWTLPARPAVLAFGAVAAGILWVLRLPWRWRLLGVAWVLPFLLWRWPVPAAGEFELVALDVGQGQAVLVRTRDHALLYDAGPLYARRGERQVDAGERVVVPYLRARGVVLDRLLLSHADSDHTGGAAAVLADQPDADWLGSIPAGHALHSLRPGQGCQAGLQWQWDGVDFRVLWPHRADEPAMRADPNGQSCVLWVANGRESVLLPGDIGVRQERELLARWPQLGPVSGWLMPHHGSRTSSAASTLAALQPRWAVAQAGYRNRFGHPHPQVVARHERLGVQVFDSPRCGAWSWASARPLLFGCYRVDAARYWTHQPAYP